MDARRFRYESKYVTYFLRELGIFGIWKKYLRFRAIRGSGTDGTEISKYYNPEWYSHIDCIFGMSDFTSYLKRYHHMSFKYNYTSSEWFRAFLKVYAPQVKVSCTANRDLVDYMKFYYEKKNFKDILIRYD